MLGFLKESIKCIFLTLAGGKKSIAHVYGCQPGKEMIKSYMDLHARQGPSEYIRGITYIFFMVIFLFKTSFCARIILLLATQIKSPSFTKYVNSNGINNQEPIKTPRGRGCLLASKASVMDGDGQRFLLPGGLPSRISWPPSGGAGPLDFMPREQGRVWPWPQATSPSASICLCRLDLAKQAVCLQ